MEIPISADEVIRVDGLERDRRRRQDLRITLPDGRVFIAHGRRVNEPGWEVYPEDESDYIVGDDLGSSVACLLGYEPWHDEGPEWLEQFREALAQ